MDQEFKDWCRQAPAWQLYDEADFIEESTGQLPLLALFRPCLTAVWQQYGLIKLEIARRELLVEDALRC